MGRELTLFPTSLLITSQHDMMQVGPRLEIQTKVQRGSHLTRSSAYPLILLYLSSIPWENSPKSDWQAWTRWMLAARPKSAWDPKFVTQCVVLHDLRLPMFHSEGLQEAESEVWKLSRQIRGVDLCGWDCYSRSIIGRQQRHTEMNQQEFERLQEVLHHIGRWSVLPHVQGLSWKLEKSRENSANPSASVSQHSFSGRG